MQLSPYRVQLAGVRTSRVEFLPLVRELTLAGLLEASSASDDPPRLLLYADVPEADAGWVQAGQGVELAADAFPGQTFAARVVEAAPHLTPRTRELRVRLEVEDPRRELRPGMYAAGTLRVPLAGLPEQRRLAREEWRDRTAAGLCLASLGSPLGPPPGSGLDTLLDGALAQAALHQGVIPVVPETAVVETGTRKVVFLERSPGLFDAVEVRLGRRCGPYYPVLGGVEPGEAVVSAGAFLLDAETRLNPAAAASYFGAGSRGGGGSPAAPGPLPESPGLSPEDARLAARQKVCPVMDEPLGSMGPPVRVVVEGRVVFVCCAGCAPALKKDPAKYLAKLPK
jgi:hypothetical protein